jgi:D-glycero-alpha-D-manno-heptose-7-phosphate kinase
MAPMSPRGGMVVTRTPLRISFAGGGTDLSAFYESDYGAVFSTSIDRYVYVTVKRHGEVFDERFRLNYSTSESVHELDAIRNDIARECLRFLDIDPPIYVSVVSDLPDSSGLGGSSAFAVGLLHALHTFRGERVTAGQLAEEASQIEIDVLRQPIGKQDQYAAAFGGLNLFRFEANGDVTVQPQRVRNGMVERLFERVLMLWTGHQRKASAILSEQRATVADHMADLRAMRDHAHRLQKLTADGEFDARTFGAVLDESWRLKRGLASTISTDQIDDWYRRGMEAGASGGKLCGAGGGGFFLFIVEPDCRQAVLGALEGLTPVEVGYEAHGSRVVLPQSS